MQKEYSMVQSTQTHTHTSHTHTHSHQLHTHTLTPVTHTHTLTPVTKQKKTVLLITVICKSETELTASVLEKEDPKHKRLKERFSVSTFCSVLFN